MWNGARHQPRILGLGISISCVVDTDGNSRYYLLIIVVLFCYNHDGFSRGENIPEAVHFTAPDIADVGYISGK